MSKRNTKGNAPLLPEQEVPPHKKTSKSASRSVGARRSDHKHAYQKVIIQDDPAGGMRSRCHWAKRCRICGRVDDSNWLKESDDLVKTRKTVPVGNSTCTISLYYSVPELRKKFPEVTIMRYDYDNREFEEVVT